MPSTSGRETLRSVMSEGPSRPRGRRFAFFGEVFGELSKVTWPSREDATRLTLLVILVAVTIGAFLSLWDFGFSEIVERVLI